MESIESMKAQAKEAREREIAELDARTEQAPEELAQPEPIQELVETTENKAMPQAQDSEQSEEEYPEDVAEDPKKRNAFAKLRNDLKQRDSEYNALKEQIARLEGAMSAKVAPEPERKQEVIPDRDVEPDEYFDYQLKKKDERLANLERKIEEQQAQQSVSQAESQYKLIESEYAKKNDSYLDAKNHLINARREELKRIAPMATESQITQQIKQDEYNLVANLAKAGLDEDAIFENIAMQARKRGYQAKVNTPKSGINEAAIQRNIAKNANLNDLSSSQNLSTYSPSSMQKMSVDNLAKISNNPAELKKFKQAMRKIELGA